MKLVPKKISTRWIFPFGDNRPECLEIRSLSPMESAQVLDKYKITIGSKNGTTFTQNMKANLEIMKMSILSWKGFEDDKGAELLCTDQNKEMLHDRSVCTIEGVNDDGEVVEYTIWEMAQKLFREAEDADRKNG